MPVWPLRAEYRPKCRLPWSVMSSPTNTAGEPASSGQLLNAALSLAQTQIVGQLADESSVDGRTMGTLGFSGALLAADLAARGVLGVLWWILMLVLGAATLCCLGPTLGVGVHFVRTTDIGPNANAFYLGYRADSSQAAREQLLSDLDRALYSNARRLRAKERALRTAVVILAVGLPFSIMLIGLSDRLG